jgi:hypothetical protein
MRYALLVSDQCSKIKSLDCGIKPPQNIKNINNIINVIYVDDDLTRLVNNIYLCVKLRKNLVFLTVKNF